MKVDESAADNAAKTDEVKTEACENEPTEAVEEEGSPEGEPAAASDQLQKQIDSLKEQNVRLLADFDNYRRRVARERDETYEHAKENVVSEFLPVMDNFERAISQAPAVGDPFADGVRMIFSGIKDALAKSGVAAFSAIGKPFDPAEHEAISYQPSPDADEGVVIFEVKCGYKLGDKVIRPATVVVSSGKPEAKADEAAGEKAGEPAAEDAPAAEQAE